MGVLPYLKVVGNICMIDLFLTFSDPSGYLLYIQPDLIDPLYLQKNRSVSITLKSSKEGVKAKVGLFWGINLSFDHFIAFCTNFLLDF